MSPDSEAARAQPGPFQGIRILDFTQLVAGSYATFQLALMGADVIKVERRDGDPLRYWNVSETPAGADWMEQGLAPIWQALNAGKRSIILDLQQAGAIEIVKALAAQADVVVENFRPGVMDKLGIGYAVLSQVNPRLIYCALSAFGQTGPDRLGTAYDGKMQAMSGLMAMTGHPSTGPVRTGFAVCDVLAGATAALGLSSALFQRNATGRGSLVDVSMLEATLAFLSYPIAEHMLAGGVSKLSGNKAANNSATADLFRTSDGHILFSVVTQKQFVNLMQGLGREDLVEDPRFIDEMARRIHEPELRALIEDALQAKSTGEWESILNAAGAPCSRIWKVEEVIDHPQVVDRGAMLPVETIHGARKLAGLGFRIDGHNGRIARPAPRLGQDRDEVLATAGLGHDEILELHRCAIV